MWNGMKMHENSMNSFVISKPTFRDDTLIITVQQKNFLMWNR